jgi:hypothetical protein
MEHSRCGDNKREGLVIRWIACAIAALLKPEALLVAENVCLRQQLIVLQRRQPRPRLLGADRRFYGADCREWFAKLSEIQKALTQEAMIIYENGDKLGAAQIVANLPPAPKRPDRYMISESDFL